MDAFYVFYVNRSFLLQIDISVAMQSVRELQLFIHDTTGVRVDDQVLLMNGGTALDADKRVSVYSGLGTETNPVFLFSRCSKADADQMSCSQDLNDLKRLIDELHERAEAVCHVEGHEALLQMPECARQSRAVAQTGITLCARLVQEHQFLYQGWLALVANLDDSVAKLKKRVTRFKQHSDRIDTLRSRASQLLDNFDAVLEQLQKIVLPRSLLEAAPPLSQPATSSQEMNLYEWISLADTNYSLHDLVVQVRDQFSKFDKSDARRVLDVFESVMEQSRNDEYREIRGMNRRFTQLDHSLRTVDEKEKELVKHVNAITQTLVRADNEMLERNRANINREIQTLLSDHRDRMNKIMAIIADIKNVSELFCKSKTELLNNIRTRLAGWVVQAYEKLHHANVGIVVFEEKFGGLKQRLDLVKQIRDAPNVFLSAVQEAIRRSEFHTEFKSWLKQHTEKCESVYSEEQQNRSTFSSKLEHHFLRVLFQGMFDVFPLFFVRDVAAFDTELPKIEKQYFHDLRKALPECRDMLRVTVPQVFSRLVIRDPMLGSMAHGMRRDESFYTPDRVHNFARTESANWMSTDDTMDMSPAGTPNLGMLAKSPPSNFGSQQSLLMQPTQPAQPLHPLSPLCVPEESSSHVGSVKSAPILIPSHRTDIMREVGRQQISEKSSQFSTPEDSFEQSQRQEKSEYFRGEDPTSRSQTLEALKPIAQDITTLKKEILDVRATLSDYMNSAPDVLVCDWQKLALAVAAKWQATIESKSQCFQKQLQSLQGETEDSKTELALLQTALEQRDAELEELRKLQTEKDEELKRLREEAQLTEKRLQETKDEIYKQLTIEYELGIDKLKSEFDFKTEMDQKALRDLKKELEKKDAELHKLKSDPQSSVFRENVEVDVRAEVEREFKSKIDLMMKGQQKKQEETVARFKKDIEYDFKSKKQELETMVKMLCYERDLLRAIVNKTVTENDPQDVQAVIDQVHKATEREKQEKQRSLTTSFFGHLERESVAAQTDVTDMPVREATPSKDDLPSPRDMNESCFVECTTPQAGDVPNYPLSEFVQQSSVDQAEQPSETHDSESPEISRAELNSVATQTRVSLKAFDMLVNIQHVYEGSTVLVLWNERHSAYVVFCTSPFLYFVKESSVRRLGLSSSSNSGSPRQSYVVAKVVHVDFCAIRKQDNRYKLPVDARVYRVDVVGIPADQLAAPSRREPSTSIQRT